MLRTLRVFAFLALVLAAPAFAQPAGGAHDFNWEIGGWDTQVRVRAPLSEDATWTEFRGTSMVHAFGDGRSNLVDLDVANGERRIEGVSLRLYNPQTRQWSLNFASMRDGALTAPVHGGFESGAGSVLWPGYGRRPLCSGAVRDLRYHRKLRALRAILLR